MLSGALSPNLLFQNRHLTLFRRLSSLDAGHEGRRALGATRSCPNPSKLTTLPKMATPNAQYETLNPPKANADLVLTTLAANPYFFIEQSKRAQMVSKILCNLFGMLCFDPQFQECVETGYEGKCAQKYQNCGHQIGSSPNILKTLI